MANAYVNKVQLADGTSLIDISDTTATADKILSGYTAYGADGSKLTGTATGGSVTQDQDGFIVLPPDGGGSSSSNVTLIASTELEVSTSSTSQTSLGNVTGTANARTANAIVYVRVRDKAGKRQGYFYGSDTFFLEAYVANGVTTAENRGVKTMLTYNSSSQFVPYLSTGTSGYGVFPNSIYSQGNIAMYARYDATYSGTIDGTYAVDVFLIETPDNITPFAYREE